MIDEQRAIAGCCLELGAGDAGFYTPIVRGGHPMSVRMLCLGRHWNARTYTYEDCRTDIDGRPAPALPGALARAAERAGRDAGFTFTPDLCIVRWYGASSRMGLHQWVESAVTHMNLKSFIARVTKAGGQYDVMGVVLNDGTPIKSVEVKVDDGSWQAAKMDPATNGKYSWKLFNYTWSGASAGRAHARLARDRRRRQGSAHRKGTREQEDVSRRQLPVSTQGDGQLILRAMTRDNRAAELAPAALSYGHRV